ncbi:MAG: histidine phosphatase family protein [Alphaproteobacteria bacterium]|nr:histidine phosphatase family protein [Alphaproteobacteria bacterium]
MKDGVTLYCIRHGLTDWNAKSRYQGQEDIPLNEEGIRQAHRNGQALQGFLPEIAEADFVSSPLSRSRDTMRIIREELGLPADEGVTFDDRLMEVHYGEWQGQLLEDLKQSQAEALAARRDDPFNFKPPGGESYADLMARMREWLETVARDTVVVTHGGITRALRTDLLNLDPNYILELNVPQDRVMIIHRGEMRWA